MKKTWIVILFLILLSGSTAFGEEKCEVAGWDSPTPNYMKCYPLPEGYTMADHAAYYDTNLYPDIWWKVSRTYNPRYVDLPYGSSSWDEYRYSLEGTYGTEIYKASMWGQQALKEDEQSCLEFAYQIIANPVQERGHHEMIYSTYDWAGCWPKKVLGEDGYLVYATDLDPYLTTWEELRECGSRHGYGTVYAKKFDDPASPDYLETKGCCEGVVYNWEEKCCVYDEHYVSHIVDPLPDGSCPNIVNKCEAGGTLDPCDMAQCLGDEDCPIEVVESHVFKEIGPIRHFPCAPEILQCLFDGIPNFPRGCNTGKTCCTYHEGLTLEIVTEDCNGVQSSMSIPLHFGKDEDKDLGLIPTQCAAEELFTDGSQLVPSDTEQAEPVSIPGKTSVSSEGFLGIAAPPVKSNDLLITPAEEEKNLLSIQAFGNSIPDDACVIENNFNNGQSVLVCRCPELSASGFCVKNLGVLESQEETAFTGAATFEEQKTETLLFSGKSSLSPDKGPLPIERVCEVKGVDPITTDGLKDLLDFACGENGDYRTDDNNCGTMHDKILGKLGIEDPNDLGDDCVVADEKCGDCIMGASDIDASNN